MNPLGNWYFILGVVVFFTPIIWFVTDRIVEPRLGVWNERSEEHTSELQSLMRISYAVFCLKKKTKRSIPSMLLLHFNIQCHTHLTTILNLSGKLIQKYRD